MRHLSALFILTLCLTHSLFAVGAEPKANQREVIQKFQYKSALKASQDAIGRILNDYPLTDEAGRALSLSDFRGKPLVLSLIYTSCYQICPMTTRHLAKVVEKAREALGEDAFEVAVLGFDSQYDTPLAMRHFAKKQGIEDAGWHLLNADMDTIGALSKELGFLFFPSPNGFDHIVQATVIDAEGRIYRQVYGEVFETPLLVEPLMELLLNKPNTNKTFFSDLVDRVRFFCTTYDPARDGYYFDYSLFIGLTIGIFVLTFTALFIFLELHKDRKRPPTH